MSILNYTTKIDPGKTVQEIQSILGRKGAKTVSAQYEGGEPSAIFFSIDVGTTPINFRLPCNWQGVFSVIKRDNKIPRTMKNEDQAKRTAWRILKDWVEAQLALIEAGQAELAEVFLPYAVLNTGETMYQRIANKPQILIGM